MGFLVYAGTFLGSFAGANIISGLVCGTMLTRNNLIFSAIIATVSTISYSFLSSLGTQSSPLMAVATNTVVGGSIGSVLVYLASVEPKSPMTIASVAGSATVIGSTIGYAINRFYSSSSSSPHFD